MLKKIGIGLAVLVLGLVVLIAVQPSTFRVERSQEIDAPPYVAFNLINNFRRWSAWSPWEKLDPNLQRKYSGAEAGVGAVYEWSGNDQAGEGRMTITESVPAKKVGIKLEFKKPFEATNTTLFSLDRAGDKVKVTWAMEGTNNFIGKAMCLVMDMDQLIGKDFEAGLSQLKKIAEQEAKQIARKKAEQAKRAAEAAKAGTEAKAAAPAEDEAPEATSQQMP